MLLVRVATTVAVALTLGACATTSSGAASGAQNTVPSASQTALSTAIDAATAPFVGSTKSKKFYPADCHTVKLIKAGDRIGFASIKDAQAAGYSKDAYSTDCKY